jgi:hypothetical protein
VSSEFKLTGHRDVWIWALCFAIFIFVFHGIQLLGEFVDFVPFTVLLGIVVFYALQKLRERIFPQSADVVARPESGWIERKIGRFWSDGIVALGGLALATHFILKSTEAPLGHNDRFDAFMAGPMLVVIFSLLLPHIKLIRNRKFQ